MAEDAPVLTNALGRHIISQVSRTESEVCQDVKRINEFKKKFSLE